MILLVNRVKYILHKGDVKFNCFSIGSAIMKKIYQYVKFGHPSAFLLYIYQAYQMAITTFTYFLNIWKQHDVDYFVLFILPGFGAYTFRYRQSSIVSSMKCFNLDMRVLIVSGNVSIAFSFLWKHGFENVDIGFRISHVS